MKKVLPDVEILADNSNGDMLKLIERCGRIAYKSEDKITEDSASQFVRSIIKRGHESVLEHGVITVKAITDRGIANEIVRHRIGSYTQESTRYCAYNKDKFGNEIKCIMPRGLTSSLQIRMWENAVQLAEEEYFNLLEIGVSPQDARSVLPLSLATEIVITFNIREWRHFIKLRTSPGAHPDMIRLAMMILKEFKQHYKVLFDDIE